MGSHNTHNTIDNNQYFCKSETIDYDEYFSKSESVEKSTDSVDINTIYSRAHKNYFSMLSDEIIFKISLTSDRDSIISLCRTNKRFLSFLVTIITSGIKNLFLTTEQTSITCMLYW